MADLKIALVQGKAATIKTPLLVLQFFEKNLELSGSGAELDDKLGTRDVPEVEHVPHGTA